MSWVAGHELPLRLGVFVFLLLAAWEVIGPRRALHNTRRSRWPSNVGLAVISGVSGTR